LASRIGVMPLRVVISVLVLTSAVGFEPIRMFEGQLHVLILGGSGFIGGELTQALLDRGDVVMLLNRGNWRWDSDTEVRPHVEHIRCDRDALQHCAALRAVEWVDVVVDLSGMNGPHVRSALSILSGRVGRWIFISSDSVYEVCPPIAGKNSTTEDMAARPTSVAEAALLARRDAYGNAKLEAEEALAAQAAVPWVTLRMADVIGQRDNTFRLWVYLLWISAHEKMRIPVHLPSMLTRRPLAFVEVGDVVGAIVKTATAPLSSLNTAYNIASVTATLEQLINHLAMCMDVPLLILNHTLTPQTVVLYPSVTRAPIDSTKFRDALHWRPAPWNLQRTVNFYRSARWNPKFRREFITALAKLTGALKLNTSDSAFKALQDHVRTELKATLPSAASEVRS